MTLIHAIAGLPQYERHIRAVWQHLPDEMRGEFLTGRQAVGVRHARKSVFMVGAGPEILRAAQAQVYVEHGAGQSYKGDPATVGRVGYHGAVHDKRVSWYLCPREDVARSWERMAFIAGCPALDRLAGLPPQSPPAIAITFHWGPTRLCPEARSAIEHYWGRMAEMVAHIRAEGFTVLGHWHPRIPTLRELWRKLGVEVVADVDEVLARCCALIADNTSVLYEAAALGRPVIVLNAPWYRRDVEHGLRFWSHVPGWQIDSVDQFLGLHLAEYIVEDWSADIRVNAVSYAYGGVTPGLAGRRAAAWVADVVSRATL